MRVSARPWHDRLRRGIGRVAAQIIAFAADWALRAAPPRARVWPTRVWLGWVTGVVAVLWLGSTTVHRVGPHQQAIVSGAGAWGPAHGAGLLFSWPWPYGAVRIVDVTTVRHLTVPEHDGEHLALTGDGALIDVTYDVRWRVQNLRRYALALADPQNTVRLSAEAAMREALAGRRFADLTSADPAMLGADAARRLRARLNRIGAGVAIDGIDLRHMAAPARLGEAMRKVTGARADAAIEATDAHSWAGQLVTHAQGEAGAFDRVYGQYHQAPAVTRQRMYYETMERVLSQSDKVIVDAPGVTVPMPATGSAAAAAAAGNADRQPSSSGKTADGH